MHHIGIGKVPSFINSWTNVFLISARWIAEKDTSNPFPVMNIGSLQWEQGFPFMKTGFPCENLLQRENPALARFWSCCSVESSLIFQLSGLQRSCERSSGEPHCCRLQAIYSPITGKNFVTVYTAYTSSQYFVINFVGKSHIHLYQ